MGADEILLLFRKNGTAHDVLGSIAWISLVVFVRLASLRLVRTRMTPGDPVILRATLQIKRAAVVLILLGLGLIWATELQTMALSLTAIAVALVIATKEVLLCVMGSLIRASAGSFTVGDRIELGGVRGDVIDHGLFATTLIEVGPGHRWTGRAVTVPNSVLLSAPVINETYSHAYVLHVISVPIEAGIDALLAEEQLVEAAREACRPFIGTAKATLIREAAARGLERPITEPHVIFQVPDAGQHTLLLRLPVPARDKGDVEQQILRRFLAWLMTERRAS